ncbi:TRAUB-domain-containing protein [Neoconidiobolus thromboides FSU 785]|nr:TRAUB-domain-containing protein [Neoconidiobolus thromboides FSU 785]
MSKKNSNLPLSLKNKLKHLTSSTMPKDLDPENYLFSEKQNSDSENEEENEELAREHYIEVGISKLRNDLELPTDNPKYKGKAKSRAEIFGSETEEEEDNEEEDEEDEEEIESGSEEERSDIELGQEEESIEEDGSEEDSSEEDSEEDIEEEDEEETDSQIGVEDEEMDLELTAELKKAQEEEAELKQKMNDNRVSDAVKGKYIKNQMSIWEAGLDLRIRYQKILLLANQLPQKNKEIIEELKKDKDNNKIMDQNQKELIQLIYKLLETRKNYLNKEDKTSVSLKRDIDTVNLDDIWNDLNEFNTKFESYRNTTIEKWNNKIKFNDGGLLIGNKKFKALDQSILTQINTIFNDPQRLLNRIHIQRNDYSIIGKQKKENEDMDNEIFDDSDFYQQLLKEFIDSRMIDNDNQNLSELRWAALKTSKQKNKIVDTKASKGRKLRFHVHDKLQSFMVPIPKQKWHSEMIDELYSSLFSFRNNNINKEEEGDGELQNNDGLRIFG